MGASSPAKWAVNNASVGILIQGAGVGGAVVCGVPTSCFRFANQL